MLFGRDFPPVMVPLAKFEGKVRSKHVLVRAKQQGRLLKDLLAYASAYGAMPERLQRVMRFYGACVLRLGWFHSDPHPGNIMFDEDGRLALLDWGAAVQLQAGEAELLRSLFGIICYAAPPETPAAVDAVDAEMAQCMRDLGFRTKCDSDGGLAALARCVFASPAVEALSADDPTPPLGDVDDPPDDIPPRMAQLIRVIATLEGTARRAGCPARVAEEWCPFLATQNAFTDLSGLQRKSSMVRKASRASRRTLKCNAPHVELQALVQLATPEVVGAAPEALHAESENSDPDSDSDFPIF